MENHQLPPIEKTRLSQSSLPLAAQTSPLSPRNKGTVDPYREKDQVFRREKSSSYHEQKHCSSVHDKKFINTSAQTINQRKRYLGNRNQGNNNEEDGSPKKMIKIEFINSSQDEVLSENQNPAVSNREHEICGVLEVGAARVQENLSICQIQKGFATKNRENLGERAKSNEIGFPQHLIVTDCAVQPQESTDCQTETELINGRQRITRSPNFDNQYYPDRKQEVSYISKENLIVSDEEAKIAVAKADIEEIQEIEEVVEVEEIQEVLEVEEIKEVLEEVEEDVLEAAQEEQIREIVEDEKEGDDEEEEKEELEKEEVKGKEVIGVEKEIVEVAFGVEKAIGVEEAVEVETAAGAEVTIRVEEAKVEVEEETIEIEAIVELEAIVEVQDLTEIEEAIVKVEAIQLEEAPVEITETTVELAEATVEVAEATVEIEVATEGVEEGRAVDDAIAEVGELQELEEEEEEGHAEEMVDEDEELADNDDDNNDDIEMLLNLVDMRAQLNRLIYGVQFQINDNYRVSPHELRDIQLQMQALVSATMLAKRRVDLKSLIPEDRSLLDLRVLFRLCLHLAAWLKRYTGGSSRNTLTKFPVAHFFY